jgi:hypothetical protein
MREMRQIFPCHFSLSQMRHRGVPRQGGSPISDQVLRHQASRNERKKDLLVAADEQHLG